METLEIKKEMKEIFRLVFMRGFAEGVRYTISGGDVSDKEALVKNAGNKADEFEADTLKNIEE